MSMTLRRNTNSDQAAADGQPPEAETQMRRALGLLPSAGPRARPRPGGDGPVVEHRGDRQTGSSVNRIAAAEAALTEERHAREQLTRQLREAEAALREAQTKRGHAELAKDEALAALAAERAAREAAEEQLTQLSMVQQTMAQHAPATEPATPPARANTARRRAAALADPAAAPKRRGRPPGSGAKPTHAAPAAPAEPEGDDSGAVEWWVPGWKERI